MTSRVEETKQNQTSEFVTEKRNERKQNGTTAYNKRL